MSIASAPDTLVTDDVGSLDWTGASAPPGGRHSGKSTITMKDGARYVVAHNRAEVLTKLSPAPATSSPPWVAFDIPDSAIPVVLNASNIATITEITGTP